MHADLNLQGWFLWLVYGVTLVLLACAVLVLVSALRRSASDFGRLGRWPWVALQGLFVSLAAFVVASSIIEIGPGLPTWFASLLGVVVVAAGIQQVAYLLRVVYPAPGRGGPTPSEKHPEASESDTGENHSL